jgi:hypothetical protein
MRRRELGAALPFRRDHPCAAARSAAAWQRMKAARAGAVRAMGRRESAGVVSVVFMDGLWIKAKRCPSPRKPFPSKGERLGNELGLAS